MVAKGTRGPLARVQDGRCCHDDDFVSRLYFSCGCTVERDNSASPIGGECVSGESISGGDAPDVNLLEGKNSSRFHQRRVYLYASLVVEVSTCDSCSVNLALEHSQLQFGLLLSFPTKSGVTR